MNDKVQDLNILYKKRVKVVGVTFNPHPKNIHKIIKNGLYYHEIKQYNGYKDKDLVKNDLSLKEFNYEILSDVTLIPYKFKDEDAIKVLINDYENDDLEVGNIPKKEVNNLLPYLNKNNDIIINAYLCGGNLKDIIHDHKKDYIITKELNIGITLDIIIKEK